MPLNIKEGLTFDDLLLIPKHSNIKTRKDISVSVELSKGLSFKHFLVPANMATVSGAEMALTAFTAGGMAILHRFMPPNDQIKLAKELGSLCSSGKAENHIGFSVGVKKEDYNMVDEFASYGAKILCIDIAHGDSEHCVQMTRYISETYPYIFLISGNVATREAAKTLWRAGADAVKIGIGSGSLCSTRIETGNGIPQLTALSEASDMRKILTDNKAVSKPIFIISDGGARNNGDYVKALCFSDMVMTGSLFAGCVETPGKTITINDITYKDYVGSSTYKANHIEGVSALVKCKGTYQEIIDKTLESVRSGCSYQGVNNIKDLQKDPQFISITNSGLAESHPHIKGQIKE